MKILCVQLARFGDIYQTWPTLNALKRAHPNAQIHFLVRERFQSATIGLSAVDKVIALPNRDIFSSLFAERPLIDVALRKLTDFTNKMKAENYDQIINLSFSPVSSYLVDIIATPTASISGYTRHKDGFLCIPDDASSYFYAQAGTERSNRIHLTDLFALVAGVELGPQDFRSPECERSAELPNKYMVIHVGASQLDKACSAKSWSSITSSFLDFYEGKIVFVGAQGEEHLVPTKLNSPQIVDLVGKTKIQDLFSVLKGAELLVGCDSVAIHVASLVGVPTLNISFSNVRFWETGPRASGSRVLWFSADNQVEPKQISKEVKLMLEKQPASNFSIEKVEADGVLYKLNGYKEDNFSWELVRALYMSISFPVSQSSTVRHGFTRLGELARLGLDQILVIQDRQKQSLALSILDEIDSLIEQVGKFVPEIGPVVRWFQTEKLRIGPSSMNEVVLITRSIFEKLRDICQIYELNQAFNESLPREDLSWKS